MATEEWKKEVQKHEQYIKDLEQKYAEKCKELKVVNLDYAEKSVFSLKVPLRPNCGYPFFYIFVHNKSFRKILLNFNILRTLELTFFGPLFPRIYDRHQFNSQKYHTG